MPHIQQLSAHLAELIAAGEVVERPASVVKELVENAIDAGSSAIIVEVQRGGMGLIRVTDNGCGIAPEELPTAFLRHATSKLRSETDLGKIGTLGFRGEALAAISAVSRTEILSRQKDAQDGAFLRAEGGSIGTVEEAGAPEGTTVVVRDLFYNTPARLKFMRKDSAENAAIAGLMQQLALSHPQVSFKLIRDGVQVLHTPGDGTLRSAIYETLGRDFAKSMVSVEGIGGEIKVSGFVTAPLMSRGSRSMQVFFVNHRVVKVPLLAAALEESYRNRIMKGKFPGCVLHITLPVELVDVNVHPAKTQVKFAREKDVFDAVYYSVMDALDRMEGENRAPAAAAAQTTPRGDFFQNMDAKTFRDKVKASGSTPALRPDKPAWNTELRVKERVADSGALLSNWTEKAGKFEAATPATPERPVPAAISPKEQPVLQTVLPQKPAMPKAEPERQKPAMPKTEPGQQEPEQLQLQEEPKQIPWRMIGEAMNTYILCEDAEHALWLIDKHAAHERIRFDALKASQTAPMSQILLRPVVAELGQEDGTLLLEHTELLERCGFACEDFGNGAVLVRQAPSDLDEGSIVSVLEDVAEQLRTGRTPEEKQDRLFRTIACKAAIKGGWTSDAAELKVLVEQVQSGAVRFCPHGRPVAVKMSRYELEKLFKRA